MSNDKPPLGVRMGHPAAERSQDPPPRRKVLGVTIPPMPQVPNFSPEIREKKPDSLLPHGPKAWAGAVVMIIAAMGGAEGLKSLTGAGEASKAQLRALSEQVRSQQEHHEKMAAYLRQLNQDDHERWKIAVGVLCRLNARDAINAKPGDVREFSRRLDCDEIERWEPLPLGQWTPNKARAPWPARTPPPDL